MFWQCSPGFSGCSVVVDETNRKNFFDLFFSHGGAQKHVVQHSLTKQYLRPFPGAVPLPEGGVHRRQGLSWNSGQSVGGEGGSFRAPKSRPTKIMTFLPRPRDG